MSNASTPRTISRLAIDDDAVARAEAALRSLSSQFEQWLREELAKLEASRRALPSGPLDRKDLNGLYTQAHDLKGLGATYDFPLISRVAASLCRLLDATRHVGEPTLRLVDAHLETIQAIVRENRRDEDDVDGVRRVQALEQGVDLSLSDRSTS